MKHESMTQQDFEQLREAFLDDSLTDVQKEQLRVWFAGHPEDEKAIQVELAFLNQIASDDNNLSDGQSFCDRVMAAWEEEQQQEVTTFKINRWMRPAVGVAAAILLGLTIWVVNFANQPAAPFEISALKPGKATSPVSVLFRDFQKQYQDQSSQVKEVIRQPSSMMGLTGMFKAIVPKDMPLDGEAKAKKQS